jgi:hypothetical protein
MRKNRREAVRILEKHGFLELFWKFMFSSESAQTSRTRVHFDTETEEKLHGK